MSKANNSLNFLRCNLRINNIPLKLKAYKSLVRPLLEYSCSVWDPYTDDLINKVEMVQHRAARFCVNNYARPSSITNILSDLSLPPLAQRRRQARLTMFYKMHKNDVAVNIHSHLHPKSSVRSRLENSQAYHLPHSRTNYFKMSFFPRTARDWNTLPESAVAASSALAFKHLCPRSD